MYTRVHSHGKAMTTCYTLFRHKRTNNIYHCQLWQRQTTITAVGSDRQQSLQPSLTKTTITAANFDKHNNNHCSQLWQRQQSLQPTLTKTTTITAVSSDRQQQSLQSALTKTTITAANSDKDNNNHSSQLWQRQTTITAAKDREQALTVSSCNRARGSLFTVPVAVAPVVGGALTGGW